MSARRLTFALFALSLFGFAAPASAEVPKEKRHALLVGVKSYDAAKLSDLKFTENDVEGIAAVLKKARYDEVVVLTTTRGEKDEKARPTRANIQRQLKRLLANLTKRDVILVALAGHGVQYEVKVDGKRRDESFFCPSDAKLIDSDDFARHAQTLLPFRKLFKQLDESNAGSRLLLVDACRNEVSSSRNASTDAMPQPARGTAALFACKGGERAYESDKLGDRRGNGIFFYHVIEALNAAARSEDGELTWDALTLHVRKRVARSVAQHIGGGARQTPELMARLEGDPVLLRLPRKKAGEPGRYTDRAGRFAVAMPGKVKQESEDLGKGRKRHLVAARWKGRNYQVSYIDFDRETVEGKELLAVLKAFRSGSREGKTFEGEKELSLGKDRVPGLEYRLDAGNDVFARERLFLAGTRLYAVMIATLEDRDFLSSGEADRFFESFTLTR